MTQLQAVLLAGGSGTRLWPLSRELYPKQFLALLGDLSCFQQTCERTAGLCELGPIVLCNEEHRFLVVEQCAQVGQAPAAIILEPEPRNTAPAIALAALRALELATEANAEEPLLLILPSDHHIPQTAAFHELIGVGAAAAAAGRLLTFGITPTAPHTGYGYIQQGASRSDGSYDVAQFVEKPDLERARALLETGDHLWNSGMFLFKASAFLAELERLQPRMFEACSEAMAQPTHDLDFIRPGRAFLRAPAQSIDYAVMEDTEVAAVVPADIRWNDLGSWDALWQVSEKDENGNSAHGDVITQQTCNSFIHAEDRLVATLGIDNLVIIDTSDALLVADKDQVGLVGDLVKKLKAERRSEPHAHARVYRPWGSYESIDFGDRYQVKMIRVKPGASLSLQKHFHRAEHWIVVHGTAIVTCNDTERVVFENQSSYIPVGATHRLHNPGKLELEMIEVQIGSYLGEDDIVRFEDNYGRTDQR